SLEKLSTLRDSRPLHWRQVRLLRSTKLVLIVWLTKDAAKRACTAASEPKMILGVTSTTRPLFLRLTTWASCKSAGGRRLGVGLGPRLPGMCRRLSGVPYTCNKAWA